MLDTIPRFDMARRPERQHLRFLIWALCQPTLWRHRTQLKKIDMEGVKPPYLLLCNHNAFMDFKVASRATFPHRANYVVAIDGFIGREWLLRFIGCICKRKFTRDTVMVRHLMRVIRVGDIAAIYPEARYSLCGTTAVLPASIGKLAKLLKVPVVTLICSGHHINSPFWNLPDHGVKPTAATMRRILTAEDVVSLPHERLTEIIREAFQYDDFRWQKENNIRVTYPERARGLHKVLYQCPHCGREYAMTSGGTILTCTACGKRGEMTELGELRALEGETEFSHIPDWYAWERANVRAEVERGDYRFRCRARVDALPNARRFLDLGMAELRHDMTGFTLTGTEPDGKPYEVHIAARTQYSCHIEYEYLGKHGDCVDLNTDKDTLYVYPQDCEFSVTKLALATEELYAFHHENKGAAVKK